MAGYNDFKTLKTDSQKSPEPEQKKDTKISISRFKGILHRTTSTVTNCDNGNITSSKIDYFAIQVDEGNGPIKLAQRLKEYSGIDIDWFYDIVMQNEKLFRFDISKPYHLIENYLHKDDILTVSLLTIMGEYNPSICPIKVEPVEVEDEFQSSDTINSMVQTFDYDGDKYKFATKATISAWAKISLIIGVKETAVDANISLGVTAEGSGTISSTPDFLYNEASINSTLTGVAGGEVAGYYLGGQAEVKYIMYGTDSGTWDFSVSKIIEKRNEIDPILSTSNSVKIQVTAYDSNSDETTIIISYKFAGTVSERIRTAHPLINIEFEAGGAIEGTMYAIVPGNPLELSNTKDPTFSLPNKLKL